MKKIILSSLLFFLSLDVSNAQLLNLCNWRNIAVCPKKMTKQVNEILQVYQATHKVKCLVTKVEPEKSTAECYKVDNCKNNDCEIVFSHKLDFVGDCKCGELKNLKFEE